jgi:PTH1 family peptidyl-tRNA hydrolase
VKLVVGLGNPGPRYAPTRHNAGFRVVHCFADRHRIDLSARRFGGHFGRGSVEGADASPLETSVLLPETHMNLSGDAVAAALGGLPRVDPRDDLVVVCDDVDLPFGRLRLRSAGGSGGHRGLAHLIERLGHGEFPRLRFGVGRPPQGMETSDYVLQRFAAEEEAALGERVAAAADAVDAVLAEGIVSAMNRFNREVAPAAERG